MTEWTGPDEDFPDVVNANSSIEFLQQDHKKPFFLVYGLWRPHNPYTAPKRFFDLYDPAKITVPPGYKEGDLYDVPPGGRRLSDIWGNRWLNSGKSHPENWKRILHGYLAATSFADWNVGRVLDAVDAAGIADPNNGRIAGQPIVSVDFFTTLMDYCSLERPDHDPQGLSLRPLLEDPDTTWKRPAITTYGENMFSARNERFRYIRYPDGQEELYDHNKDPNEFINLADKPDYRYIKERFKKWIPEEFAVDLGGRNG